MTGNAAYFLRPWPSRPKPELAVRGKLPWLGRLETEHDNLLSTMYLGWWKPG